MFMEEVQQKPQDTLANRRRSFTREFKLGVIKCRKHVKSIHRTSDKYKIDRKQVRSWLKKEKSIVGQKKRTKARRHDKPPSPSDNPPPPQKKGLMKQISPGAYVPSFTVLVFTLKQKLNIIRNTDVTKVIITMQCLHYCSVL